MPRVELLWWDGCPSYDQALSELQEVLAQEDLDPEAVELCQVSTEAESEEERFVGSPTIRIGGEEVAPVAGEPFGLTCRVYRLRDGRVSPVPDREDVRDVVRRAKARA